MSTRASVVGRGSLGERAVKHDSMFTVCLGVVAIQSMLEAGVEHALPLTLCENG